MEWKLVLLYQMQLILIGLLSIAIGVGCKRDAPRYEAGPIAPTENKKLFNRSQNNIKGPTQPISNGYTLFPALSNKINNDVAVILNDIGWSDLLSSQFRNSKKLRSLRIPLPAAAYAQNDFSSFIEAHLLDRKKTASIALSHPLPSRLVIVFDNNQQHNSCDKRRLVGAEFITVRSNAGNSEKHTYALIGFLIHIAKHSPASEEHSIRFVQSEKKWYFDNNTSQDSISTQEAIKLASERGTIFFYKKIT
ncbi:hypothetical protein ACRRVD_02735 [Candidatus Cardinium hertigii]|uniref:hypothetical protein n=1 Tax=Candidatus Cardinium hertigii TaxID=247481 RepID=UPI003D7EA599